MTIYFLRLKIVSLNPESNSLKHVLVGNWTVKFQLRLRKLTKAKSKNMRGRFKTFARSSHLSSKESMLLSKT